MTTSATDRAHKLALECVRSCREDGLDKSLSEYDRVAALIAAAITQAENEKLEEAAKSLTARILDYEDSDADPEFDVTDTVVAYELRQARDEIRSLKHPKD